MYNFFSSTVKLIIYIRLGGLIYIKKELRRRERERGNIRKVEEEEKKKRKKEQVQIFRNLTCRFIPIFF